jgi:hypothetical protein
MILYASSPRFGAGVNGYGPGACRVAVQPDFHDFFASFATFCSKNPAAATEARQERKEDRKINDRKMAPEE